MRGPETGLQLILQPHQNMSYSVEFSSDTTNLLGKKTKNKKEKKRRDIGENLNIGICNAHCCVVVLCHFFVVSFNSFALVVLVRAACGCCELFCCVGLGSFIHFFLVFFVSLHIFVNNELIKFVPCKKKKKQKEKEKEEKMLNRTEHRKCMNFFILYNFRYSIFLYVSWFEFSKYMYAQVDRFFCSSFSPSFFIFFSTTTVTTSSVSSNNILENI